MRAIIFLIAFLLCGSLLAQCPGGVCQRPVQATKSVLVKTTKVVQKATVRESRRVRPVRLFRRWR